jgi:hypothetical protein
MSKSLNSRPHRRQAADVALLVTTAALIVSLAVAAAAVSIGIARATIVEIARTTAG